MVKTKTLDDPYEFSRSAQKHESKGDKQEAEKAFKLAIRAADALPIDEYRENLRVVTEQLTRGKADGAKLVEGGLDLDTITHAYHELIAMPFLTRVQLAGFYARYGECDKAKQLCNQAFELGLVAETLRTPTVAVMEQRAGQLTNALHDMLGPANAEKLFEEIFDKLDINRDGFVDETELRRALLDIDIDEDAHTLIRFLLHNYEAVMQSSRDQLWFADFLGISKDDLKNYQKNKKAKGKRNSSEV